MVRLAGVSRRSPGCSQISTRDARLSLYEHELSFFSGLAYVGFV